MKGRILITNPKELSKKAKFFGFSLGEFMFFFVFILITSKININGMLKILPPIVILGINKLLNGKHPFAVYRYFFKKNKNLKWAGVIREIKK